MKQISGLLVFFLFVLIPTKSFGNPQAEKLYNQAIQLIEQVETEDHQTRYYIDPEYMGPWEEAEKKLSRAIELNPSFGAAYSLSCT